MPPLGTPLAHPTFTLNAAGVAGFFGGKEAISAMATVHLYKGRRWLGWYNSPGSYTIAKRFGRMANNRFWDGLFPGPNDSPAVSLGLDGKDGPKYTAALSGTVMQTGHLGYLTMKQSQETDAIDIEGLRKTAPVYVSYLALEPFSYDATVKCRPLKDALLAIIPITCSVVTCIFCGLVYDWYCFSMILLGILSSGLASWTIGKGKLAITSVKKAADSSPPGDGVLMEGNEAVVIKGREEDVNAITKGHFYLETEPQLLRKKEKGGKKRYHAIGFCSLLLIVQFLLQLLLIPQGTLFGQIMFLSSLGVSWAYNSYLSSLEKEKIQMKILFENLGSPKVRRFRVGTRTTMAVFVCLLLFRDVHAHTEQEEHELRTEILRSVIPNNTVVWRRWRERVVERLLHLNDGSTLELEVKDEDLSESQRVLLGGLFRDAEAALEGYFHYFRKPENKI